MLRRILPLAPWPYIGPCCEPKHAHSGWLKATPGDKHVFHVLRKQRSVRNIDRFAIGRVAPFSVFAGVMVLNGRAAKPDNIIEFRRMEHVISR